MLPHFIFLKIGRDLHMAHSESRCIATHDIQSMPMVLHTFTRHSHKEGISTLQSPDKTPTKHRAVSYQA